MRKLTVLIPCKNEEHNIRACMESVRGLADEIIVADSGSTDRTLEIVREIGNCRVIERDFRGYSDFKNWAIPQAQHEWILSLDADERVTPALVDEIRDVLSGEPPYDAYSVRYLVYFMGQPIRHSGWGTSFVRRLFRRDVCRFSDCRVHESLVVPSGKVGHLKNQLDHFTCRDYGEFVAKQNRYSTAAALDLFDQGRRTSWLKLLFKGPLRFLQLFFVRRGFLDGRAGIIVCSTMAFYSFLKEAKLWALAQSTETGPASSSAGINARGGRVDSKQTPQSKAA